MWFGVCAGADRAKTAADAGLEFLEMTVGGLLKPREDESDFREALDEVRAAPLPCPVVNCFVPGDLKITGPEADMAALEAYVRVACERAGAAGVEVIVFGSGGARRIPDGFERDRAHDQIVEFCRMLGPVAEESGVTIAVEPLSAKDCNVLTTVGESAALVREVGHPAVRLLVDFYHWARDGDSAADIVAAGDLLVHTHVATVPGRMPPGAEECDLAPFFRALKEAGYDGRVSIEARIGEPEKELPGAVEVMRELSA